ncbi:MAG: UDP-glucose 4-epimerase GalE [Verrucomicrobiales bacterium]
MLTKEKAVLVTGGAGYIGSHTVRQLVEHHRDCCVVVLDSLERGHAESILDPEVKLFTGDMADQELVEEVFTTFQIEAVIHFAAYTYVGESVAEPLKYYRNNTAAPLTILEAMQRHGCKQFIFSSTAATYGNPVAIPMTEEHPQQPINPYGASKLMLEQIIRDCESAWGLRAVFLRYFNASGCAPDAAIGEDHDPETHLIPLILMAISGERENITVFGENYETPDGTCVRDYIHVLDLANAHLKALDYLDKGGATVACNLGTGKGVSVREMLAIAEAVTGIKVPVVYGERRPGDPAELVADPARARAILGWEAEYTDVTEIVATAWKWMTGPAKGRYANVKR